ncbi:MAG: PH domain-containing protein [Ignavibacteria bacterium]|jgi:uncharacterized membrane protein YdbT with pleckstrin-like domain|nr:PH domain-containing protein [Ignavibacteria bacterium]
MKTDLKKDEVIVLITRTHWLTFFMPALLLLISIAGGILLLPFGPLALLIIVPALLYFGYKYLLWNHNIWAVTNLRVIDEEGFFDITSKESPLDKINNVSFNQHLFGRIFNYGDVDIQTAAEIGETTYKFVHNPDILKSKITEMQENYKDYQAKKQAEFIASAMDKKSETDIASEIEKLHQLKVKGIITEEEFNARKRKLLDS